MNTPTVSRRRRLDAPFWARLIIGVISLGTVGCFALAAAQSAPEEVAIVSTDDIAPPGDL